MKPEESPVRMPLSEITATMEPLAAEGVVTEDFRKLRGNGSTFRVKMLAQQLAIGRKSFLSNPGGWTSYDERWAAVEKLLFDTASRIHHVVKPQTAFEAFAIVVDRCCDFYEYEFIAWQAVCEAVYQISCSCRAKQPEAIEGIRQVLASMERDPKFRIGCHHFDCFMPPDYKDQLALRKILPIGEQTGLGIEPVWPRDRMARLQMILARFRYWAE